MQLLIEIAWTHISVRIRQTLIAILGVALGVGFTIGMSGLMEGSQKDFVRMLVDSMPHVTVSSERKGARLHPAEEFFAAAQPSGALGANKSESIRNPNEVMALLRSWLPGAIAPVAKTNVMINYGRERFGVTLVGIDPRQEQEVSQLPNQMLAGQINDLYKSANALIIGEGLAKKIGVSAGGVVNISVGEGVMVSGPIVGIFRSGMRDIDESQVYCLLRTAQILAGQPGIINELRIHLHDASQAREISERVSEQTGYRAVSWQEANAALLTAFSLQGILTYLVMTGILLVSTTGIYSIISTIVHEKQHDIAIMKSFGMKEGRVRTIFIIESAMIGAVGVIAGWALGYAICLGVSQIMFTNPITGDTRGLPVTYALVHYVVVAVIALLSCAAAGFLPARKASRVHPVEIIRGAA